MHLPRFNSKFGSRVITTATDWANLRVLWKVLVPALVGELCGLGVRMRAAEFCTSGETGTYLDQLGIWWKEEAERLARGLGT